MTVTKIGAVKTFAHGCIYSTALLLVLLLQYIFNPITTISVAMGMHVVLV